MPGNLVLGVDKHRKYAIIELVFVLVFVMGDHIAGQKLNERRLSSCYKKMEEIENKLDQYENSEDKNLIQP